jgi:hypothetical protein
LAQLVLELANISEESKSPLIKTAVASALNGIFSKPPENKSATKTDKKDGDKKGTDKEAGKEEGAKNDAAKQ